MTPILIGFLILYPREQKTTRMEVHSRTAPEYYPARATVESAGFDIRAKLSEPLTIGPHTTYQIPTGVYARAQDGHYVQLCTKSSWAKKGRIVGGGVIDRDYQGQWFVCIGNLTDTPFVINDKEFIAQAVIVKNNSTIKMIDEWEVSARGDLGFGGATNKFLGVEPQDDKPQDNAEQPQNKKHKSCEWCGHECL